MHPSPSCALNLRLVGDMQRVAKTRCWHQVDTEAEWVAVKKRNIAAKHSASVVAIAMPEEFPAMLDLLSASLRPPRPQADCCVYACIHYFGVHSMGWTC